MEETVTISLKQYNELIETKKKYETSDNSSLEYTIGRLKKNNKELESWNSWLEGKNSTIKNETTNFWLTYFRDLGIDNENVFGYVKAKKIYSQYVTNKKVDVNEYDLYNKYPAFLKNEKIALNKSECIDDYDVLKLQIDIERAIRRFLANNPRFKDGYELNFSVDDLPSLLEKGTTFTSSDVALTIFDKDNNKIIESI